TSKTTTTELATTVTTESTTATTTKEATTSKTTTTELATTVTTESTTSEATTTEVARTSQTTPEVTDTATPTIGTTPMAVEGTTPKTTALTTKKITRCLGRSDFANIYDNSSYYYNYRVGVHAFCPASDKICIAQIQSNGIGYDMRRGMGLMGRAVSLAEHYISRVRAACSEWRDLKLLAFTKSGKKYLHNLEGRGLKQGWVSTVKGSCGANVPIRRWKSRVSDDMMYGVDLEWNTWY
ncbi:hypothetical protein PMAYCL1PPCAC_15767, partial [Pristionchus mayeri]